MTDHAGACLRVAGAWPRAQVAGPDGDTVPAHHGSQYNMKKKVQSDEIKLYYKKGPSA